MKRVGAAKPPVVLCHAGASNRPPDPNQHEANLTELARIADVTWAELQRGASAIDAASAAIERLEAFPNFNAGLGSALQADGIARLSASLMDGARGRFSGISLAEGIIHPSRLTRTLQDRQFHVLGGKGAKLLQQELGIPDEDPATENQRERWKNYTADQGHDTVGTVVLDRSGKLAAATSTGGLFYATVDRISDVSTVAGNFASEFAAVSCTGIGEDIVDAAAAAKIESRIEAGASLEETSDVFEQKWRSRRLRFGWIAIDHSAHWAGYFLTQYMYAAKRSAEDTSAQLLWR